MKTSLVRRPVLLAAALALLVLTARPARADDGLFADFTTSYGPFTCQLDYTAAPKAVANFVGLATGAQPWLNLPNGRVRSTPFYDGLLFHRVISGFMIQGGSPNAQGTDGPGYVFTDECSPILRFDGPGVLAMANSGTNSNGAQFFITVAATAWLNDVHTIFGRVVSGQPVVTAISLAAVDTSSKPLTNIVIQKVAIRRVGAAALAFNINAQGLPVMTNTPVALTSSPGRADLVYSNRPFAANTLYSSTNLAQWTSLSLGVDPGAPATNAFSKTNTGPREFYHVAQAMYPSSTFTPRSALNRTFVLNITGTGALTIVLNGTGGGTYTLPGYANGTITSYTWTQEPYTGRLWPVYFSGLAPMTLRLGFTSTTGGYFTGTVYSGSTFTIGGSFTMTP